MALGELAAREMRRRECVEGPCGDERKVAALAVVESNREVVEAALAVGDAGCVGGDLLDIGV
jgi:hypothetical protein